MPASWFVIERHNNQKPLLTGPFRTECDADAYVSGMLGEALAWVVQAQAVDDDA